jgi:uncharacterized membrane protein YbaN (DUF454 family)
MKNLVYTGLGAIFLLLGVAGIVLPLVPATPFLLLAAFFFSRGSPKFHRWLLTHKQLGPPIRDWEENKIIRRKTKVLATAMLMASAIYIFPRPAIPMVGKVSFGCIALSVLYFIWTRKEERNFTVVPGNTTEVEVSSPE